MSCSWALKIEQAYHFYMHYTYAGCDGENRARSKIMETSKCTLQNFKENHSRHAFETTYWVTWRRQVFKAHTQKQAQFLKHKLHNLFGSLTCILCHYQCKAISNISYIKINFRWMSGEEHKKIVSNYELMSTIQYWPFALRCLRKISWYCT